jgi:hypothetical protein
MIPFIFWIPIILYIPLICISGIASLTAVHWVPNHGYHSNRYGRYGRYGLVLESEFIFILILSSLLRSLLLLYQPVDNNPILVSIHYWLPFPWDKIEIREKVQKYKISSTFITYISDILEVFQGRCYRDKKQGYYSLLRGVSSWEFLWFTRRAVDHKKVINDNHVYLCPAIRLIPVFL